MRKLILSRAAQDAATVATTVSAALAALCTVVAALANDVPWTTAVGCAAWLFVSAAASAWVGFKAGWLRWEVPPESPVPPCPDAGPNDGYR